MAVAAKRQGGSRATLCVIGALAAAFALLALYQYLNRSHFVSDPERLKKLEHIETLGSSATPPPNQAKPGEWPQWRGPERTGVSAESGWSTDWPAKGPKLLWRKKAGAGYSSLAVTGGLVFTMLRDDDEEAVICLDARTGKQKWRHAYPGQYDSYPFEASYGPGPRSTPAVGDGLVYAVGATGIFHCLRADTGKVVWRKDLLEQFGAKNTKWGISFSPLVDGDLVFVNPGEKNGGSLAAFHKKTGKLKWSALDDPAAYSSPVVSMAQGIRQIVFFTAKGVVSVVPGTGEVLWRFPWETNYDCNVATPIVASNYVFISSGYDRGCAVVEIEKDASGKLQAHRVYEHKEMCNHFSTSVLYKGNLYGFDESRLTCMDFRTGKIRWKESGFKKGSLIVVDGYLIVLGANGKVALAKASPEHFNVQSSFQVSREKCWTAPVLAEGKLFVRDEASLFCYDLKGTK